MPNGLLMPPLQPPVGSTDAFFEWLTTLVPPPLAALLRLLLLGCFALVMVDPAPIGKTHDTITLGTSSTMVYTGFGVSNWTAGNEAMMSRGFSYEGTMRALVYRAQAD